MWAVRNSFYNIVKRTFPRTGNLRKLLVERKVVARLTPCPLDVEGDEAQELLLFWGLTDRWLHLSGVALSPWSIQVHEMREARGDERVSANPVADEIPLKDL